ncbi:MAG: sigma-70 family RNA polymerase sigma factor [Anaerovibrio sp.]|nr:sigma-70 family RNA polymerase sigma factor [Anaerovibrio sp.]
MTKYGCARKSNGQFKKCGNNNALVNVQCQDGSILEMPKVELDSYLDEHCSYALYQSGIYIIVDEAVYRTVKQADWREAKRDERNKKANELFEEKTADGNVKVSAHNEISVGDFYDNAKIVNQLSESPEEHLINQERMDALYEVLATLSARDREIIQLFSLKYTDAKIGERIGMSQRGVNKRKKAILAQMKTLLEKIL